MVIPESTLPACDSEGFIDLQSAEAEWYGRVQDEEPLEGASQMSHSEVQDELDQVLERFYPAQASSSSHLTPGPSSVLEVRPLSADRAFFDLQRRAVDSLGDHFMRNKPLFCWEKPARLPFTWEVRGSSPPVGVGDCLKGFEDEAEEARPPKVAPIKIRKLQRIPVLRSDDDHRTDALRKLRCLVMHDPECTRLGISLLGLLGAASNEGLIQKSFVDAFRKKATGTLRKRAGSLMRYFKWALEEQRPSPFAVSEEVMYSFANFMRDSRAKPTSLSHFFESLHFLHGVAVFVHMEPEKVLSSRVQGIGRELFMQKRPLQQKPELKVDMLTALEAFCVETDSASACICGQLLFCAHSAARWEDGQRIVALEFQVTDEVSLLIGSGLTSKTTLTQEAKTRLLPYVALGHGISGKPWARAWLDARKEQGLKCEGTVQPSWIESQSKWASTPMGSSEASSYLQDFLLIKGFEEKLACSRTSHSLKATLTSWAGRCPKPKFSPTEQRMLGHHLAPKDRSPATYSRQKYTLLYGRVLAMFRAINDGEFDPDLPEVDRVVAAAAVESGQQDPGEGQSLLEGGGPAEDSPQSSSESSCVQIRRGQNLVREPFGPDVPSKDLRVHTISGITHCLRDRDFLMRGRPLSRNYVCFDDAGPSADDFETCKQCKLRASHT